MVSQGLMPSLWGNSFWPPGKDRFSFQRRLLEITDTNSHAQKGQIQWCGKVFATFLIFILFFCMSHSKYFPSSNKFVYCIRTTQNALRCVGSKVILFFPTISLALETLSHKVLMRPVCLKKVVTANRKIQSI